MVNSLLLLLLSTTAGVQDPTRPLTAAPVTPAVVEQSAVPSPQLQLQATFTGERASAIIDGARYQVGDSINSYRLVRIGTHQVWLEGQGKPLALTLFPSLLNLSN